LKKLAKPWANNWKQAPFTLPAQQKTGRERWSLIWLKSLQMQSRRSSRSSTSTSFFTKKKKKEKEIKAKAAKTVIKEIRFGPNTDDHDFDFKLRHAKGFLEDGAKVKAYVHFRGRTIVFKERGELLLLRFLKELEEYGSAEALPKMEGRRMIVMISPKKSKKK